MNIETRGSIVWPTLAGSLSDLLIYLTFFVYCATSASADLLPLEARDMVERLSAHPKIFDRFEISCEGKKVDSPCNIIGTVLQGGGHGVCKNWPNVDNNTIDLTCERNDSVIIDRQIPETKFYVDGDICEQENKQVLQTIVEGNFSCEFQDAIPYDRFCLKKM